MTNCNMHCENVKSERGSQEKNKNRMNLVKNLSLMIVHLDLLPIKANKGLVSNKHIYNSIPNKDVRQTIQGQGNTPYKPSEE